GFRNPQGLSFSRQGLYFAQRLSSGCQQYREDVFWLLAGNLEIEGVRAHINLVIPGDFAA
ncbi:MAG: hypothetical protein WCH74_02210, partial [Chloroflexota bacterium]